MKRFTKILAVALLVVLMLALVACSNDDTQKRVDNVKKNYRDAGYTVTQIQKDDDLVKDKAAHLAEVSEIYKITKAAAEEDETEDGELYLLFVFKDDTKAQALHDAYGAGDDLLRASGKNVVLVAEYGNNTKPFMDAYEDVKNS